MVGQLFDDERETDSYYTARRDELRRHQTRVSELLLIIKPESNVDVNDVMPNSPMKYSSCSSYSSSDNSISDIEFKDVNEDENSKNCDKMHNNDVLGSNANDCNVDNMSNSKNVCNSVCNASNDCTVVNEVRNDVIDEVHVNNDSTKDKTTKSKVQSKSKSKNTKVNSKSVVVNKRNSKSETTANKCIVNAVNDYVNNDDISSDDSDMEVAYNLRNKRKAFLKNNSYSDSDAEYNVVKESKKGKSKRVKVVSETTAISNKFDTLNNVDENGKIVNAENASVSAKQSKQTKQSVKKNLGAKVSSGDNNVNAGNNNVANQGASTSKNTNDNNVLNVSQKNVKSYNFSVPPIMFAPIDNYTTVIKNINEHLKKKLVCRPANGGELIRIYPESPEEHRYITGYFETNKIQHYVLPLRSGRPYKIVIRGLPLNTNIDEVKAELAEMGFDIIKVAQMISRRTEAPLPLYQVHVRRTGIYEDILKLEYLLCMSVEVEEYRGAGGVAQCHNCQRFHHSSEICKMSPRCVKCSMPHKANDCPLGKKVLQQELVCANCKGNHPASYRGCEKYPKLPTRREGMLYSEVTKQSQNSQDAATADNRPTFAEIASAKSTQLPTSTASQPRRAAQQKTTEGASGVLMDSMKNIFNDIVMSIFKKI